MGHDDVANWFTHTYNIVNEMRLIMDDGNVKK